MIAGPIANITLTFSGFRRAGPLSSALLSFPVLEAGGPIAGIDISFIETLRAGSIFDHLLIAIPAIAGPIFDHRVNFIPPPKPIGGGPIRTMFVEPILFRRGGPIMSCRIITFPLITPTNPYVPPQLKIPVTHVQTCVGTGCDGTCTAQPGYSPGVCGNEYLGGAST